MKLTHTLTSTVCALAMASAPALLAADLPDPDSKPADMSKPVQVFLVMGQSNTLEMGKVNDELKTAYPFLADDAGNWTTRQDVRNVSVMQMRGNMRVYRNEWLSMEGKKKIGIEIGIGHQLGNAVDAPVMVLKSSIGNRSLGWDLLPPGTPRYTAEGIECPGYGETYVSKQDKAIVKFEEGKTLGWYAGKQYDDDVGNAKKILAELDKHYPGAKEYEVAGIIWWQGDKDMRNAAHAAMYEQNLGYLLKALRKDFNAPEAKFVCASLGQTDESDTESGHGKILHAMKRFAASSDDIDFVYSKPLLDAPSSSSGHYSGNAKTYMNVGLALGETMVELVK